MKIKRNDGFIINHVLFDIIFESRVTSFTLLSDVSFKDRDKMRQKNLSSNTS
jgi:hypothetical protein